MNPGLNPDLVARVTVDDGESSDEATGYPITPNRIITAGHLLFDEEGEPLYEDAKIQVNFDGTQFDEPLDVTQVCWNGLKETGEDVAVLECVFPIGVTCHHCLPAAPLSDPGHWHALGFAAGNEDLDQPASVAGDFPATGTATEQLVLPTRTQRDKWEDWYGVSGGPVFRTDHADDVSGLPRFAAIIIEYRDGAAPDEFLAVPIWKLLESDSFGAAVDVDRFKAERKTLEGLIADVNRQLEALDDVKDALKFFRDRLKTDLSNAIEPKDVARQLVAMPSVDLAERIKNVFRDFVDERTEREWRIVEEIEDLLLPIRCLPDLRTQIQDRLGGNRGIMIEGLVGHWSIAELIMAGVDGRRASFVVRDPQRGPVGDLSFELPEVLPGGPTDRSLEAAVDLLRSVATSMTDSVKLLVEMDRIETAMKDLKKFPEISPGIPDYAAQLKFLAAEFDDELHAASGHKGRTFYCVFRYPADDEEQRTVLRNAIEAITNEMNHLTFLELVNDREVAARERPFVRCIRFRHADKRGV